MNWPVRYPQNIVLGWLLAVEPARRKPGALAMDPAIIGGIIQGVAMMLCPFLTALLIRVQEHKGNSVVIILPDKTKHELGTDATPEQISQVTRAVEAAGSADKGRVLSPCGPTADAPDEALIRRSPSLNSELREGAATSPLVAPKSRYSCTVH